MIMLGEIGAIAEAAAVGLAQFTIVTSGTPEDFIVRIDGAVDLIVDWGDGSGDETFNGDSLRTHAYATADTYTMKVVSGTATKIAFGAAGFATTPLLLTAVVTTISPDIGLTSAASMFRGCTNCTSWAPGFFDEASAEILNVTFMFAFTSFSDDVSGWNTAKITNMAYMFFACSAFNQDVSGFDMSLVTTAVNMFNSSAFSQTNLDKVYSLTTGWPSQALQDNVEVHFGTAKYDGETADIADGRAHLVAATPGGFAWTITDGGDD